MGLGMLALIAVLGGVTLSGGTKKTGTSTKSNGKEAPNGNKNYGNPYAKGKSNKKRKY